MVLWVKHGPPIDRGVGKGMLLLTAKRSWILHIALQNALNHLIESLVAASSRRRSAAGPSLPTKPCRTRVGDKEWRNGRRAPTQDPSTIIVVAKWFLYCIHRMQLRTLLTILPKRLAAPHNDWVGRGSNFWAQSLKNRPGIRFSETLKVHSKLCVFSDSKHQPPPFLHLGT